LYERDVLPEDEQAWIINGMYRLYDQFHGGYVRQPHTAEITLDFEGKNYCDTDYEIDEIGLEVHATEQGVGKKIVRGVEGRIELHVSKP
jgi:hypothetical protein